MGLAMDTTNENITRFALSTWKTANEIESFSEFLDRAVSSIANVLNAKFVTIVRPRKGQWESLSEFGGSESELPYEAFASVLDQEEIVSEGRWRVAPLLAKNHHRDVLAVLTNQQAGEVESEVISCLAEILVDTWQAFRRRSGAENRAVRLESILEILAGWNQMPDMNSLLVQMAESATERLASERASIFLWDRSQKTLVGRPALGVEGNELRIPDDAGIVGQVIQTGESRRVDADIDADQKEVHREVDQKLNFQTRSLLCVPLVGREGELFGAFEVINKIKGNFSDEDEEALIELAKHAAIALENTHEREQLLQVRKQMADQAAEQVQLIGDCPAIEALRSTVQRVAKTELAILILGENGTGKEVISQMVHYWSSRRNEPFVAVNCAALTETLLESELFGHEKGAFTDAHESRQGKFELASGGTLFLDEIGDMSMSGQAKLLRVLEEKVVVRVGGSTPIHTDARVIAATNQDLAAMVRERRFREDLFFRLNVVTIELPPLRDRGDDVLLLAEHFLKEFSAKARRRTPKFTASARKRLIGHSWPGNIRELRNLMERLAYLSPEDKIDAADLAFIISDPNESSSLMMLNLPLNDATREFQIEYIKKQIERARGNMTEAAKRLGLHRSNLYRKMRQLQMPTDEEGGD